MTALWLFFPTNLSHQKWFIYCLPAMKKAVSIHLTKCVRWCCARENNNWWPMTIFYGILNMAFINSYVIYCHNSIFNNQKTLSRKSYMKSLSLSLKTPWIQKRLEIPTWSKPYAVILKVSWKKNSKIDLVLGEVSLPQKRRGTVAFDVSMSKKWHA